MQTDLTETIEAIITPVLKDLELELFDLIIEYRNKVTAIEIITDKAHGGITIDECSAINKKLSVALEEQGLIDGDYTVEVSSPGLDRPLKTEKDFVRVQGKDVKFHLKEKINGKLEHDGVIQDIKNDEVFIETKKQETITIPLPTIQKAVQII